MSSLMPLPTKIILLLTSISICYSCHFRVTVDEIPGAWQHAIQYFYFRSLKQIIIFYYYHSIINQSPRKGRKKKEMCEVVSVHIGGCGAKMGVEYWKKIRAERSQSSQLPHNFFNQNIKGSHSPKAIFIDKDSLTQNFLKSHQNSSLNINPSNILISKYPSYNVYGECYYEAELTFKEEIEDILRKEAEKCDVLSGFILTTSGTGGTGTGTHALLLSKMREIYCHKIVESFVIHPGVEEQGREEEDENQFRPNIVQCSPLGIYNSIFQNQMMIEYSDLIHFLDNKAAQRIVRGTKFYQYSQGFSQINDYLGNFLAQYTLPYQSSGSLNTNQRKRSTNLVPFPRIKLLRGSYGCGKYCLEDSMLAKSQLLSWTGKNQKHLYTLNANIINDPEISEFQIDSRVRKCLQKDRNIRCSWIPHNVHCSIAQTNPSPFSSCSLTRSLIISNSSQNINLIKHTLRLFDLQFQKKAFLHPYLRAGMDEMQFSEAQSISNDLTFDYVPYGVDLISVEGEQGLEEEEEE